MAQYWECSFNGHHGFVSWTETSTSVLNFLVLESFSQLFAREP
jgi:hypothetical protein